MATRTTGEPSPRSIRFTPENDEALTTAAALTPGASINSLVNQAVSSYFAQPAVVASLRSSYASFVNNTTTYQDTIDRLAGGSS